MHAIAPPPTRNLVPLLRAPSRAGAAAELPPLTVLEAGRQSLGQQLAEFWGARELLFFFVWRDVKVRYQQTTLGIAWALLQPLTQMAIFALVFGRYGGMAKTVAVPYVWFVLAGLVPWTFFANAIAAASHSMVASRDLVTKVYFPRLTIPASAVCAGLVDFGIAIALLLGAVALAGFPFGPAALAAPGLALLLLLSALGAGMLLAAGVAAYRDFRFVVPFILQVGLFCTPIIYPPTIFPEGWRWLVFLNPVAGIVEGTRASLFGGWSEATLLHVALSAGAAFALFFLGLFVFRRMERSLADRI